MSIRAYNKMIDNYVSDIQNIRKEIFDNCLEMVSKVNISTLNNELFEKFAYQVGENAFLKFSNKVRQKYVNDENSNIVEMSIRGQKKFFTGSGRYYLPQAIISLRTNCSKP